MYWWQYSPPADLDIDSSLNDSKTIRLALHACFHYARRRQLGNGLQPISRCPLRVPPIGSEQSSPSRVRNGMGQLAPPFSVSTLDGKPITNADLRATGKPYILYFYATW